MHKRVKVVIKQPVVETLGQANIMLAENAEPQRRIDLINARQKGKMDCLKKEKDTFLYEVNEETVGMKPCK